MIAEVNRTESPPEEVLSDHLYLYWRGGEGSKDSVEYRVNIMFEKLNNSNNLNWTYVVFYDIIVEVM